MRQRAKSWSFLGCFDVAEIAGREAEDDDLIAWTLAIRSLVPFFEPTGAADGVNPSTLAGRER